MADKTNSGVTLKLRQSSSLFGVDIQAGASYFNNTERILKLCPNSIDLTD